MSADNKESINTRALFPAMGAAVRRLRMQRGLTIRDLAKMVGLNPRTIGQYELGESPMSLVSLSNISKALVRGEPATQYSGIAQRMREVRESRNMTTADVAERLGLTEATVIGYENGATEPPVAAVYKLCLILDTSLEELGVEDGDAIMPVLTDGQMFGNEAIDG